MGSNPITGTVAVAEMAYAPDCGSGLCGSESRRSHYELYKNRLKHGNYYPSKDWKHSDKQKIESMDAAIADYECNIADLFD